MRRSPTRVRRWAKGDGVVTFGEAFTVQPFNNLVVTQDMTGQQIKDALEQSWQGCFGRTQATVILQTSATFHYQYNATNQTASCGNNITAMTLNGSPIDLSTTYKVAMNNFLADGGDSFPAMKAGTNRVNAARLRRRCPHAVPRRAHASRRCAGSAGPHHVYPLRPAS